MKDPLLPVAGLLAIVTGLGHVNAAEEFHEAATYEAASDLREIVVERTAVDLVADGAIDFPGVVWSGCLHEEAEFRPLPCGTTDEDQFQVSIADLVFGNDVGGYVCVDADDDLLCGEPAENEFFQSFCGSTSFSADTSSVFHIAVFVDGPVFHNLDCPATANPMGGTTGDVVMDAVIN